MRYDLDFKIKVIAYYGEGHTKGATGERFEVDPRFVRKWVKQYQSDGIDAIRPKTSKTKYSADFKYQVIALMLA